MIRFVTRTDVHLSDQTPQSRVDDWSESVLDKLVQVGQIAAEEQATAVLDNGDFFHVKSPSRTSHSLIQKVAEVQAGYPCPTLGNVGNHDCIYGDYAFLDQQPLGVLMATGVIGRCYNEHQHTFHDTDGSTVRVVGVPYHGVKYDLSRFEFKKQGEDHLVVMAHVLASPDGGSMFENEDILRYSDLKALSPEVDVWVFGHWHKDQGIKEIDGTYFINVGSLSRGSLSQDNVDRIPAVGIVEFEGGKVTCRRRNLQVKPAKEVFDMAGRVREEARQETLSRFAETVRATLAEGSSSMSLEEKVGKMDVLDQVKERALAYLEKADA